MTSDDTGMVDEQQMGERADELWRAYQLGQVSCDHTARQVFCEVVRPLIEQRDQLIEDQAWQLLHIAGLSGCLRDFVEASQDDGRYPTLVRRGQEKLDVKHPSRITRKLSVTRKGSAK